MNTRQPTSKRARTALAAALASAFAASPAHALDVFWLGGSGSWSNNGAWNTGAAPDSYGQDVFIDSRNGSPSSVWLDRSAAIGKLHLDAGNALTVSYGQTLTVGGGSVVNNGMLTLTGYAYYSVSYADLAIAGDTTLSGVGQTVLSNAYSRITAGSSGSTLTIASGHTVRGGGFLGAAGDGLSIVNQGTVTAEAATGMQVNAGSFDNRFGKVNVADGSSFSFGGNTLTGGVFQGSGYARLGGDGNYKDTTLNGNLSLGSATFSGLTTMQGANGIGPGSVYVKGSVVNNGTLTLTGYAYYSVSYADLVLAGNTTLSGSGQTVLGDYARITSGASGNTLTIANGHTVRGGGILSAAGDGLNVVNQGSVIAEAATGMNVNAGSFDNRAGTVTVADGSSFSFNGGTLTGGAFQGTGYARLAGSGTYKDTALNGNLSLSSATFSGVTTMQGANGIGPGPVFVKGSVVNNGTLTLTGYAYYSVSWADLTLAGDTTLSGSGQTVLGNPWSRITSGSSGSTLTIASGHTVRGGGFLGDGGLSVASQGSVVNRGTVFADAATPISVLLSTFDNRAGSIRIAAGSTLDIYGNLLLGDASLLKIDMAGLQYGAQNGLLRLMVGSSNLTFDGTVQLDFADYAAHVGDSFTFLTLAGGAVGSGTFDAVTATGYTLGVTYYSDHVTATVTAITAVPEPQSLPLMLAGLGVLGWLARRRAAAR